MKYRAKIIDSLYSRGRKSDTMLLCARLHYHWPGMREAIKTHVGDCKSCFKLMPSKSETPMTGLSVPLSSQKPMDWLCTDICEKTLSNSGKKRFLCIVDKASSFIVAYELRGTQTKNIVTALQSFIEMYYGPPYILTLDSRPQFSPADAAIA